MLQPIVIRNDFSMIQMMTITIWYKHYLRVSKCGSPPVTITGQVMVHGTGSKGYPQPQPRQRCQTHPMCGTTSRPRISPPWDPMWLCNAMQIQWGYCAYIDHDWYTGYTFFQMDVIKPAIKTGYIYIHIYMSHQLDMIFGSVWKWVFFGPENGHFDRWIGRMKLKMKIGVAHFHSNFHNMK
jgi:hypothetical protein